MNQDSIGQYFLQAKGENVAQAFDTFMRSAARQVFFNVMMEEVAALCGPAYRPDADSSCKRSGTAPGRYFFAAQQETISRPRVRKNGKEVQLESYQAGQDRSLLQSSMLQALMAGISTREQKELFSKSAATSRSEVSRLWQKEGAKCVETLRERDLSSSDYVVLMLDGIGLGDNLCAVVALGITSSGEKQILDFQIGSSENTEVCSDLIGNLKDRGFAPRRRLLAVTDGGKGLRSALKKHWPDVIIQRCLVHKARNIKAYLSHKHHGELEYLFSRLRKAEGLEAATEAYKDLQRFLKRKSASALTSLEEAGEEEILAVQRLGASSRLNTTLLNTNCIENSFRNVRAKIRRVSRWRDETGMARNWLAYALLKAESGFRRIRHYEDLNTLIECIDNLHLKEKEEKIKLTEAN